FALVENFWQTGYGMPGFTLLGDRVIRLPFIVHTSYGHEILHNWWGNGVFVDYEGGNWCEGLTVYGADYLYKERESPAAARDYRRAQLVEYRNYVRAGRDFPLTEFRERHDASSAAIGYGKSMMLYHMVRGELGEERFWNCLARFYDGHLFRRASWSDVLAAFAADAPFDGAAFYDQWIARAGAPALRLGATDLLPQPNGTYELAYVLEQETPLYSLTVPMRVTYADRPADNWTVRLEEGTLNGTRSLAGMPRALEVDPDFDLFRRLHPAEVPAVLSRIFGADSMTFAISGEEPAEVREAFRAVAGEAGAARPEAVSDAGTIALGDLTAGGSWIFGEPRWLDRLRPLLPDGFSIEPDGFRVEGVLHERAKSTLVLALPNPQLPEEAIGLVLSGEAQAVPAVWRKLPHYGKYSYLVFHGTENVAKGIWEADRSPLKVVWEEGS
ncbi:MAG: M1 family aminopeptidase, partial [Candidatus Eisenbacteria bacterium]